MNDIFNEQLVKRETSSKDLGLKIGIFVLAGIILLAALLVPGLGVLFFPALIILGFVIYRLMGRFNVEYEYILTNNELDIDIIYSKSKRKRLMTIDVKTFELMASMKEYPNEIRDYDKVLDYSSGVIKVNTFAIGCNLNGKKTKLIIEPNESIVKGMKMYIPQKIKK